jgi:hypothetical protein
MKTAMQELFSQLEIEHPNLFNLNTTEGKNFINNYIKFIKMEKQQIIDAYYYDPNCDKIKDDGEQYYNETFKKENNEN